MKLLAAPLVASLALALMRTHGTQPSNHSRPVPEKRAAIRFGGKVDNVLQRKMTDVVVLHGKGGTIKEALIGPAQRIVTRDGSPLSRQDVRLGDVLVWHTDTQIEDTSQVMTDLKGIVSYPLDPGGNSLVLLTDDHRSVVVDIGSRTRYIDASGRTASPADLEQADLIDVYGVLDQPLGEITHSKTVTRMAP